jgi:hypothetical protein
MRYSVIFTALVLLAACRESRRVLSESDILNQTPIDLAHDQVLIGDLPEGKAKILIKVSLAEPQMLRAEIAAAIGSNTSIKLYQNSDEPLAVVDDRPVGAAEELPPIYLAQGDARIEISAESTKRIPFKFFYRTFRPPAEVEREPNQTVATATPMQSLHASGFYGPETNIQKGVKSPEQDCYRYRTEQGKSGLLDVRVTGVDGIQPQIVIYGDNFADPITARTGETGKNLKIEDVLVDRFETLAICVNGTRKGEVVSRDYYDVTLEFSASVHKREVEPNESVQTATDVAPGNIAGSLTGLKDKDYFIYRNRSEYPVLVRVGLVSHSHDQLRLVLVASDGKDLIFEKSAPGSEIIENARVEAGESIAFSVQARPTIKRLKTNPVYDIKISESQWSDENETEPNGVAAMADSLVDATYKWGYINPLGDVDFYRLKVAGKVYRQVRVESKLACKLQLEHQRGGKILKTVAGGAMLSHEGDFKDDDLLRLSCLGQKPEPAERVYRIALME